MLKFIKALFGIKPQVEVAPELIELPEFPVKKEVKPVAVGQPKPKAEVKRKPAIKKIAAKTTKRK